MLKIENLHVTVDGALWMKLVTEPSGRVIASLGGVEVAVANQQPGMAADHGFSLAIADDGTLAHWGAGEVHLV